MAVLIVVVAGLLLCLVGLLWARHRARRAPGVFRCRLRRTGPHAGAHPAAPRRYAHWVHDVLVIHRGPTLALGRALPVAHVAGPVIGAPTRQFGDRPVSLRVLLDDGQLFDLQARNVDLPLAIGPFATTALREPD